jgi:hypothetical protein
MLTPTLIFTLKDAFKDSLETLPLLLIIYFAIEWFEYRYGSIVQVKIQRAGKAGPLLGALFGCVPQCGFSVVGSALFTKRLITIGTLLAVYLSTSDEAIPVILSQPGQAGKILPLLLTKVVVALFAGYIIDLLFRSYRRPPIDIVASLPVNAGSHVVPMHAEASHTHVVAAEDIHVEACCGHHVTDDAKKKRELWLHPLRHTAQVYVFILLVSVAINLIIYYVGGEGQLGKLLLRGTIWQPVLTSLVGLIPNCAASVAIAEMYIKGGLSYGAAISGLCSSAGLGVLVLLRDNKNKRETLLILLLLHGIAITLGICLQTFFPHYHF